MFHRQPALPVRLDNRPGSRHPKASSAAAILEQEAPAHRPAVSSNDNYRCSTVLLSVMAHPDITRETKGDAMHQTESQGAGERVGRSSKIFVTCGSSTRPETSITLPNGSFIPTTTRKQPKTTTDGNHPQVTKTQAQRPTQSSGTHELCFCRQTSCIHHS